MSISAGYIAFKLANQITPIILTRGIATALGGALPIMAITEGLNLITGLLSGTENKELDEFFCNYQPVPGSTLINNQVATYPFANQAIAANAIIAQPNTISMLMLCPAKNLFGFAAKLATMLALQTTLSQHNGSGGTYSVITPAYIYTDCILTGMRDVSSGQSKQVQYAYQLDFFQPLVSLQAAQSALNGLMQKLTDGTPISGTPGWSTGLAVGNPTSILNSSLIPQNALSSAAPTVPL